MNTFSEPINSRSQNPFVDLRTIPAGWDLSEVLPQAEVSKRERQVFGERTGALQGAGTKAHRPPAGTALVGPGDADEIPNGEATDAV